MTIIKWARMIKIWPKFEILLTFGSMIDDVTITAVYFDKYI